MVALFEPSKAFKLTAVPQSHPNQVDAHPDLSAYGFLTLAIVDPDLENRAGVVWQTEDSEIEDEYTDESAYTRKVTIYQKVVLAKSYTLYVTIRRNELVFAMYKLVVGHPRELKHSLKFYTQSEFLDDWTRPCSLRNFRANGKFFDSHLQSQHQIVWYNHGVKRHPLFREQDEDPVATPMFGVIKMAVQATLDAWALERRTGCSGLSPNLRL